MTDEHDVEGREWLSLILSGWQTMGNSFRGSPKNEVKLVHQPARRTHNEILSLFAPASVIPFH